MNSLSILLAVCASVGYGIWIAAARTKRSKDLKHRLRHVQPHHWVIVIILLTASLIIPSWYKKDAVKTMLRTHFHLPQEVEFLETRHPARGTADHIEAIVQFTDIQHKNYLAHLANPNIWRPIPIKVGNLQIEAPYSPKALKWKSLPSPFFAGTRRVRWGNLSRDKIREIKEGYAFCLALRRPLGKRKSDWWREAPKGYEKQFPLKTPSGLDQYNAINCAEMGRSENPAGYILGILDTRNRRLHMIIR
ncbi:MAG: hypothetical protein N4A65_00260 [Cohaesibacter sp.]|jgi:hypothetical protein|nr:hypothetical protein [Cohaesibacter sp.]